MVRSARHPAPNRAAVAGEPWVRPLRPLRIVLSIVLLSAAVAGAQPPPAEEAGFTLRPAVRNSVARIQSDWLDWLVAVNESDRDRAERAVDRILSRARLLRMDRVPALAAAAAQRATELAAEGHPERALWGLEAARRLDPERPEIAFAEVRVARRAGDRSGAILALLRGYRAALRAPLTRFVVLNNAALWLFVVAALSGLVLVGLLMASKGTVLYTDLLRFFERYVPPLLSHLLCLGLLLWPALLPSGLVWLAFYWSILLWRYGRRIEQVTLVAVWLVVGSLPVFVGEQARRVSLRLFEPVQAIEEAARGRLAGDLFNQLQVLESLLPESTAVHHLLADLHRRLGQYEEARALYRRTLAAEPASRSALSDLGIYYFEASDYSAAAGYFLRAASGEAEAAVLFNLSQAYSELYEFRESEEALRQARAVDPAAVSRWLQQATQDRMVALDGGLARVPEIRAELAREWRLGDAPPSWLRRWQGSLSLPLAVIFVLIALIVRLVTGSVGGRARQVRDRWWSSRIDLLRRVLLPGLPESEAGHWGRAVLSVATVTALATLPMVGRLGYAVPWSCDPPDPLLPLAVAGLLIYFSLRLLAELRSEV